MSVKTPQCEPTGCQQCRGIALYRLRLGARGQLHLTERVALLGRNSHAAGDHLRHARDVGAATAHQDLFRLLAPGAGREVKLQRAAHLLGHVVDERVEHLGLIVAGQATFLLRSEEHTSELQSQSNLVCRLLLEKKKDILLYYGCVNFASGQFFDGSSVTVLLTV